MADALSMSEPPLAQEAMVTAEADWLESYGSQPGCEEFAHVAWQAAWWKALEWAAGRIEKPLGEFMREMP